MSTGLPREFIEYFFMRRIAVIKALCDGSGHLESQLIEFTRTTPVVVTHGPAGLSGSVKMVGFVPKKEIVEVLASKAEYYAYENRPRGMRETACTLLREFYNMDLVDPLVIGGLEMGFKHSWENIRATHEAALVFYTPPVTSFEVRCSVEIREDDRDPYKRYLNGIHDIFHYSGSRSRYPAYLFRIREIYNNSSTRNGFGRRIYP